MGECGVVDLTWKRCVRIAVRANRLRSAPSCLTACMAGTNLEALAMRRHLLLLAVGTSTHPTQPRSSRKRAQTTAVLDPESNLLCRPTIDLGRSRSSVLQLRRATFPRRTSTNQRPRISQPTEAALQQLSNRANGIRDVICESCGVCTASSVVPFHAWTKPGAPNAI